MDVDIDSLLTPDDENQENHDLETEALDDHLQRKVMKRVSSASKNGTTPESFEGATYLGDFSVYGGYAVRTEDMVFPVAIANGSQSVKLDEAERIVGEFPEYFGEVAGNEDYTVGLVGDAEQLLEENGYEVSY